MQLLDSVEELLKSIRQTREYLTLCQSRALILKQPALLKKLQEHRAKGEKIWDENLSDEQCDQKMKELGKEFEALKQMPELKVFFTAGDQFTQMLDKTFQGILDVLQKETDIT